MSDEKKVIEVEVPTLEIGSGRKVDILIEDYEKPEEDIHVAIYRKMFGVGEQEEDTLVRLSVWADSGLRERLCEVEGIVKVELGKYAIHYVVTLDPRYKKEWVSAEIEAAAKMPAVVKEQTFGSDQFRFIRTPAIKNNDDWLKGITGA